MEVYYIACLLVLPSPIRAIRAWRTSAIASQNPRSLIGDEAHHRSVIG